ncbi:hypothetical protein Dimus_021654 [Dionaea muscipula]
MARRGRPKKKGGLTRDDPASRVSIAGSGAVKGARVRLDLSPHKAEEKRSEGKLISDVPTELWTDDEEVLVETAIAVDAKLGTPYLHAFQRGAERGESSKCEESPMAGNRDLRNGSVRKGRTRQEWRPKVLCGDGSGTGGLALKIDQANKPSQVTSSRVISDEWIPAKKGGSGFSGDKGSCRPGNQMQCGFGSRFTVLEEEVGSGDNLQSTSVITAVVDKQLDDICFPLTPPIT